MKQVIQNLRTGKTEIIEVPVPQPGEGQALVRTSRSLLSAGTERMVVDFAGKSLLGKARARPDLVRQTLERIRREGLFSTVEAVFNRLDQPLPLGYSSAGVVEAVGPGLIEVTVGDRVACAGAYAAHAEYVSVPRNLMARIPEGVSLEEAAFTTLGSIALHGFRLAEVQVGERLAVIGMGLLGRLACAVARAAGCSVLGIDVDAGRVEGARQAGWDAVMRSAAESAGAGFTEGLGFDAVLICADSSSSDPVELAGELARDRGKVVAVGAVNMDIPRRRYYEKELSFIVSRSYGPGRYDPGYEEGGQDYPIGYVRWTEKRNMEAFLQLMASGSLEVQSLISHRISIQEALQAYELIEQLPEEEDYLAILLTYPESPEDSLRGTRVERRPVPAGEGLRIGVLGGGSFARAVALPILSKLSRVELVGIASGRGLSAADAGRKYDFAYVTTKAEEILGDPAVNTVAVFTRHHLHAEQVAAGLKAGKHVFCEKPLAIGEEGLQLVADALAGASGALTVGYNRRFAPLARRLKEHFNEVREPLNLHYRVNAGPLPSDHWLHDPGQGGGRIIGEGCHFVDFMIFLTGARPVRVYAAGLPDRDPYREDNVTLVIGFEDGSQGTLHYLANGDRSFPKERVEVFGGGRIGVLQDFRRLELIRKGQRRIHRAWLRQDKGHLAIWKVFRRSVLQGEPLPIPLSQLLEGALATFAAVQSLREGEVVEIQSASKWLPGLQATEGEGAPSAREG